MNRRKNGCVERKDNGQNEIKKRMYQQIGGRKQRGF